MVNERIKMTIEELFDLIALAGSKCAVEHEGLNGNIVTFVASDILAKVIYHLTGKEPFSEDELKVVREIRESL